MTHTGNDRYLILSDLHMGIKESTINNSLVANALIQYIHEYGPWKAVVFNGDLLDLNMSSFQMAVEGGILDKVQIMGFRRFMTEFTQFGSYIQKVRNWIYIPGNHDYLIWTLLTNKMIYLDKLSSGEKLNVKRSSLKEGIWKKGSAFISGVFPEKIRKKVVVQYPDYVIKKNGGGIVVTHGHYLDRKQTLFKRLKELVMEMDDQKSAIEKMYVETDRFQTLTNALTYSSDLQKYLNYLLRTGRIAKSFGKTISKYILTGKKQNGFAVSPLRGERINTGQLRAAEFYLKFFRNYKEPPNHFIYGHTHRQGMSSTGKIPIQKRLYPHKAFKVYNTGAFISKSNIAASFIRIDAPADGKLTIAPVRIDKKGQLIE